MLRRRSLCLGACALAATRAAARSARVPSATRNVRVLPERLAMPGLGRERALRLYLPPSYDASPQRRYPVLYLHDAQNLFDDASSGFGEWGVDEELDALASATGFEAIVVGIDHGGDQRFNEMNPWPHARFGRGEGHAYLDFIVGVVKPWADRNLRTLREPASTLIGGASMGGLISHEAILRHPEVFGRALIFSPAYWTAPPMAERVRETRLPAGARLYFYGGAREGGNRDMVNLTAHAQALTQAHSGAQSRLSIVDTGEHNEMAWRAEFTRALRWLFEIH